MKVLSLIHIILFACVFHLHSQITPDFQIQTSTIDAAEYLLNWDENEVSLWREQFSPVLTAFAVKTDLQLHSISQEESDLQTVTIHFTRLQAVSFQLQNLKEAEFIEVYNDRNELIFPTAKISKSINSFTSEFTRTNKLVLRFRSKTQVIEVPTLSNLFFKDPALQSSQRMVGFNASLECESNAECFQDSIWKDPVRSVVRIRMVNDEGIGWCSGSLVNNTAKDGKGYILSAHHCQDGFNPQYENWRFDFNYQSTSCVNPADEPTFLSMTGCIFRSKGRDSDFFLMELIDDIPVHFEPYYNGWDRRDNYVPEKSAVIHHPAADIKKISVDEEPAEIFPFNVHWTEGYTTPPSHHYKMIFDVGIHEGGSSGSPMIDNKGRLIGQLHGGRADCQSNYGYIGRLEKSWQLGEKPEEQLAHWLDPLGLGIDTLDGMNHLQAGQTYTLQGTILDPKGKPMKQVTILIEGDLQMILTTDSTGKFELPSLPRSGNFVIKPRKNSTDQTNGVTAIDLLLIQKHILNITPFQEDYQSIAADATNNKIVSGVDLLLFQKLLLGLQSNIPNRQSWTFDPIQINLEDVDGDKVDVQIIGIKLGDVNASADPNK